MKPTPILLGINQNRKEILLPCTVGTAPDSRKPMMPHGVRRHKKNLDRPVSSHARPAYVRCLPPGRRHAPPAGDVGLQRPAARTSFQAVVPRQNPLDAYPQQRGV